MVWEEDPAVPTAVHEIGPERFPVVSVNALEVILVLTPEVVDPASVNVVAGRYNFKEA